MEMLTTLFRAKSAEKRELIGSIFSEKFTFEDLEHRTASISDSFNVIYLISKQLQGKKKGQRPEKSVLSHRVIPSGFEPETYRLEICCSIQLSYRTCNILQCKDVKICRKSQHNKLLCASYSDKVAINRT